MAQGTITGFPKDTDPTLAADSDLFVPSQKAVKTYVDTSVAASTPLSRIGSSTYSTVQHLMNFALSVGVSSGGNITVSGTANAVDVAAGTGFIKAVDSNVATESFFDWAAFPALSVPNNTTRFIGVKYNGGSPIVFTKTTNDWDLDTEFPLGVVVNESGTRYITNIPWVSADNTSNVIERFDSIAVVSRDNRVGGMMLSNTGTRNVAVSASALLARMSEFDFSAINTATSGTFDVYYRDGLGGWAKQSAQTQWNNTQYDDGTGVLATLTAAHYTSRWFYVMTDGSLAMLYGRNNDADLATALNDGTPSTAPDRITTGGLLIGRFIIQKSAGSPATTQTTFETEFSASGVTSFGDLSGSANPSQGGTGVSNNDASTITIAGSFPSTWTLTGSTSVTWPTSGLLATTSNNLGAFASTTSSQLAGVISDETGTGALVFATSPVFTTPNIDNATGNITGNAGTATALQTARTINGASFNGTANISVTPSLHIQDQKAQNTAGGTFTSGAWQTRVLNTAVTNQISGASLAANQITLPAGTYRCFWHAPAYDNITTTTHQSRLQNITGSATLLLGESRSIAMGGNSSGFGIITLAGATVIELQHQISSTQATDGFGQAANLTTEVYSNIIIEKIG